jgi:hypothetical protein
MPIKPNLNAFLICDQVLRDQHGRCSLIGVFQYLRATSLPLPPRSFSVFVSLSEVIAPQRFTLVATAPGQAQPMLEAHADCEMAVEPNQPYEINFDFNGVSFDREGDWTFELKMDNQTLAIRALGISSR